MRSISVRRMQRADHISADRYGVPVLLLMENAGRAVANAAERLLRTGSAKRRTGRRTIFVFCGAGHNGGDGIAAARTLHNRGHRVEAWLLKDPGDWKGSVALHYQMARRMGVRFRGFEGIPARRRRADLRSADLLIDALLGTGARGPVDGLFGEAIETINAALKPVLSVDIPSGLNPNTGKPMGPCVRAGLTLTLAAAKPGLTKSAARRYVGRLAVAEIGIPRQLL
jgi:hydroxyethylthiazole kinase-like uncharacterized protein yjeF